MRLRRHRLALRALQVLVACLPLGCATRETVSIGRGDAGGGDASASGGRVLGFVLVDVTTGVDLRSLGDGDTIDTTAGLVTIRAVVELPRPGSIVFRVDGTNVRTEENPPWFIAGNDPKTGAPFLWNIALGVRRVRATPYSAAQGGGVAGAFLEQTFTIK
jgi:hypothetical protein